MTETKLNVYEPAPPILSDPARPCLDKPEEWFFPPEGGGRLMAKGKRVCATCPGRVECGEWAIENIIDHGLWGGLAPRDRKRIRSDRSRAALADGQAAA